MPKPFLFLSSVVLFAIAPISTPMLAFGAAPQATPSTNPVKQTAASQEKAKKLYSMDCSMCHGDNGNGKTDLATSMNVTLSDWTDPKSLADKPDQELFNVIRKGKGDKMPPEDTSRAKDDDIWNVIHYIRAMSKGQPSAPAPATPAPAAPAPPAAAAPPGK
ncbi:MAG TPA: c-type cytochrome [Terracidiphilus sp.]|nr:c-type cytochrome [Terracidiphilus sp.]